MVDIHVRDDTLEVEVLGLHRLWALKPRIELPLTTVQSVAVGEEACAAVH